MEIRYIYSGFVTNPSLDWGELPTNSGIAHPQFNAKLPSKQTFKRTEDIKLTKRSRTYYIWIQLASMYTVPP